MEFLPKHKGVPIIPSPMGQLTIKNHSDGFMDAVVLTMPCRPQRDHARSRGFNPGMGVIDPGPPLQDRIVCPRGIRFPRKVNAAGIKQEANSTTLSNLACR